MAGPIRYKFPDGALLYCRACQDLRPHRSASNTEVVCVECSRATLIVEVVATYSADEYQNPAPILLPWRLLPEREKRRRMVAASTPQDTSTGGYKLRGIDRDILEGNVPLTIIEAMP